jgi:hypothetical protein
MRTVVVLRLLRRERFQDAERIELPEPELLGIERAGEQIRQLREPRFHRSRLQRTHDFSKLLRREIPDHPRRQLRGGLLPVLTRQTHALRAGQRGERRAELAQRRVARLVRHRFLGDHDHLAVARKLPLESVQPAHARQVLRQQREQLRFQPDGHRRPRRRAQQ